MFLKIGKILLVTIVLLSLTVFLFMQQKSFGKLPRGARQQRIEQSPNYRNGSFQNLAETPMMIEGVSYFSMLREFFKDKPERYPQAAIPTVKTDLKTWTADSPSIVWFGHSSYLILIEGKRILVDPVFSDRPSPIGGTSAGCAVLTQFIFDARNDTVVSADALANPYSLPVSVSKSFIKLPFLENTIADQHYSQRDRLGRHVTFMARMSKDFNISKSKGIAADERTAVCIDKSGNAIVLGSGNAFFLINDGNKPEVCEAGKPLSWISKNKALRVYIFQATLEGTQAFNLQHWPKKKPTEYWSVKEGVLQRIKN